MELNEEQLRQLVKETVKDALQEFFKENPLKAQTEVPPSPKKEPPKQEEGSSLPTYEELFHRIMAQVARGSIDEQTAGKLLSEAYHTFGRTEHNDTKIADDPQKATSQTHDILMRIANWEKELSNLTGEAAESTLDMMERMRSKITQEVIKNKNREDEAKMYAEAQKLEKEEQEKRASEKLKSMKDKIASDKK